VTEIQINKVRNENRIKEEALNKQHNVLNTSIERMLSIEKEISRYIDQGMESKVARNKADVEKLQNDCLKIEHDLEEGIYPMLIRQLLIKWINSSKRNQKCRLFNGE
jgi:flagellar biosynthesis GTPase FlhF